MTDRIMLINGRHAEELRVAIVENRVLDLYDVEGISASQKRGNIYRGVVSNIERSLNAAFIDIGDEKKGFLTRHDVVPQAFHRKVNDPRRAGIDEVLQKGQPITVQVTRDAEGQKGATLTTNLSVAGRFLVFLPYDEQRGVSRKVEDEDMRRKLRDKAKGLDVAEGEGFIIRTNGAEQTKTELKADLQGLTRLWKLICDEARRGRGAKLLYDDQNLLIHALRDYLDGSIDEVWIDDATLHTEADRYLGAIMPKAKLALKRYEERTPLFSRFNLEPQVAGIYRRVVPLSSGGSIVIDHTEALTAIDVNSGKARQGNTQGETAYQTNLEAAAEVARQLRLRDIGGLVVVDFIDMRAPKHQRDVEKALRDAMKVDRARHRTSRVSSNGLVEINRQRIRRALQLRTHRECPTCDGVGRLISPELSSLSLVRRIEARAATGRLAKARVALHPELADFTQNHRRYEIAELERAYGIKVEIVGDRRVEHASERIEWSNREEPKWPDEADADRPAARKGEREKREPRTDNAVSSSTMIDPTSPEREEDDEQPSRRPRRKRRRRRRGKGEGERQENERQENGRQEDERQENGRQENGRQENGRQENGRQENGRQENGRQEDVRQDDARQHAEARASDDEARGTRPVAPSRPSDARPADAPVKDPVEEGATAPERGLAAAVAEGGEDTRPADRDEGRSSRRRRRRRRRRPEGERASMSERPREVSKEAPSPHDVVAERGATPAERPATSERVAPTPPREEAPRPSEPAAKDLAKDVAKKEPEKKEPEKKEPVKKVAAKKTTKKAATKKTASKKTATKKTSTKKATTTKAASKKAATKKTSTKKAATKKAASKKAATKKTATKKATTKKAPTKKATSKKVATATEQGAG